MVVSGAVSPPQAASSSSEPHSIPTVRITSGLPFAGSSGGRHGTALAAPLSETTDGQSATNGELISADGASTLLNGNEAFIDDLRMRSATRTLIFTRTRPARCTSAKGLHEIANRSSPPLLNLVRRCQDPLGRDDTSRSPPGRPTPGTSRRYRETEGSLPTMTQ